MKSIIKKVPLPMAGLMLALAATGNLIQSYGSLYRNLFGGLSALLCALIILKGILYKKALLESLENPVVASVAPTFSMGVMLLSTYIKPLYPKVALWLWALAILMHVALIIWFTGKYMLAFQHKKVFPSYFIVYVGIVVASVTAPAYGLQSLGMGIFWFGLVSYFCLLPLTIYRLVKHPDLPEPAVPTLTIFAAPASLCLAGYTSSAPSVNMSIFTLLVCLSVIMFVGVVLYLPRMLQLKFYPSYSAFTFPLAISAIAMKKATPIISESGLETGFIKGFVMFQEMLTVAIVLYVFLRYMVFLTKASAPVKSVKA